MSDGISIGGPVSPLASLGLDGLAAQAAGAAGRPGLDPRRGVKEIEGFFIGHLLKVMRQTVPKGLFASSASDQFNYFFDQEIGRLAAESGTFGLAALVEADLRSKGLTTTNTNGLSSAPGLPIQGPSESVVPPTRIGPHTEKG